MIYEYFNTFFVRNVSSSPPGLKIPLYFTGQSFDRDNNNGLSVGFFSDALSNNIDDAFSGSRDNGNVGSNGENGNDGYRY